MKPLITLFITVLFSYGCGGQHKNNDPYYTDHGDWDDVRFPLIKPYEALCLNGVDNWSVQLTADADGLFSAPGTKQVNIVDGVILLHSTKTILNFADAKEAWFILVPAKHIQKGFAMHAKYLSYLHSLGMKNEPELYDINKVSKYFGDHDEIDWKHIND